MGGSVEVMQMGVGGGDEDFELKDLGHEETAFPRNWKATVVKVFLEVLGVMGGKGTP